MTSTHANKSAGLAFFYGSSRSRKLIVLSTFMVIVFVLSATHAHAAIIPVNNLNDSGAGSLRQAILDANAAGGSDQIQVSAGVGTINLLTPLPVITDTVSIINMDVGSGRVELNGLATQAVAFPSIGFDVQAPSCEIRGFAINRFGDAGIRVGPTGTGTIIHQNYIGTDITGNSLNCPDEKNLCGNINRGIWVDGATGVQIGTSGPSGLPNTISGNHGRGIAINGRVVGMTSAASAIIVNNLIGTDSAGNTDLGNLADGILIAGGSGSQIGGITNVNDRNVIIGNGGNGIAIVAEKTESGQPAFPASANVVRGNYIGYTLGSNQEVPNNGSGLLIQGANNVVGGTTAAARNIITGNGANGISINSALATGNTVQGNYIGVGSDGTTILGNLVNGIQISNLAANNTIGGAGVTPGSCDGACNIIANNGDAASQTARGGLYLDPTAGAGNSIRANAIFNNGSPSDKGIDLATPGTTANDSSDPDIGANNLQNFPALNSANTAGVIGGTLNSTPNTIFVIDYYRNDVADTSQAEARTYIGSSTATTNAGGNATLSFNAGPTTLSVGQFVTATATTTGGSAQAIGDTSELSNAQTVVAATPGGAAGIEGDVAPRPNGDGNIQSTDVTQMRRFLNGSDTFDTGTNEYQRADSAPYGSQGDGMIASNDVTQTRRYQNGTDPQQNAGGPTTGSRAAPGGTVAPEGKSSRTSPGIKVAASSVLRVEQAKTGSGNRVAINLRIDAVGGESEYGFTLDYDPMKLSNPVIGAGDAGAAVRACNVTVAGRITCSVGAFPNNLAGSSSSGIGELLADKDKTLITVTFDVAANATPGTTLLTLSNVNVSNDAAELMKIVSTDGEITIGGIKSGSAPVEGIVNPSTGQTLNRVRTELTRVNRRYAVAFIDSFANYME